MITYQDIKAKQQLATECTQACLLYGKKVN